MGSAEPYWSWEGRGVEALRLQYGSALRVEADKAGGAAGFQERRIVNIVCSFTLGCFW